MVLPGGAAATAAAMVEKHPALPPGFTQGDLKANAGWQRKIMSTTLAKNERGESAGCFPRWPQMDFDGLFAIIESPSDKHGALFVIRVGADEDCWQVWREMPALQASGVFLCKPRSPKIIRLVCFGACQSHALPLRTTLAA